mgnify:CR=1 FL=1
MLPPSELVVLVLWNDELSDASESDAGVEEEEDMRALSDTIRKRVEPFVLLVLLIIPREAK